MSAITKRGAATRKTMLDEATRLFSERGFEGVSTRDIAQAVGITLPSIVHFFGSKQGLYEAVIERIASELSDKMSVTSAAASKIAARRSTRPTRLKALDDLLSALTRALLSNPPAWTRLILQEQLHNSSAGRAMNEFIRVHAVEPVSQLVAALRSVPDRSTRVRLEVFMLLGGIVVFRSNRVTPFEVLQSPEYSTAMVEEIVALQRIHLYAIFGNK